VRRLSLGLLALLGSAIAEPGSAPSACPPIAGLSDVLAHWDVLLLGEIHGSNQSPTFVGDVACAVAASGRSITVGLEVAVAEQERFDAYLASNGQEADRKATLDGPFWHGPSQDGRESQAMFELLERLRRLRHEGREIHVVTLDPADPTIQPVERDRRMAEALARALTRQPQDFAISLTGNFHNRIRSAPWDATYDFMGKVFSRLAPRARVLSLNVAYSGGSSWICEATAGCGPQQLKGKPEGDPSNRITILPALDEDGYRGSYSVGKLTPAPPAAPTLPR